MLIEYTYGSKGDNPTKPANSEYHNNENDDYFINKFCGVMFGVLIGVIITTIIFTILV
jgi:tetrahydromethanopterin S-methyltransferase subunit B